MATNTRSRAGRRTTSGRSAAPLRGMDGGILMATIEVAYDDVEMA